MISIFPLGIWTLMLFNSLSPDTAWNPFFLKREEACGQQGTDVPDPSQAPATRARSSRNSGRHYLGTPGDIISECPGDFVGIRRVRGTGLVPWGVSE